VAYPQGQCAQKTTENQKGVGLCYPSRVEQVISGLSREVSGLNAKTTPSTQGKRWRLYFILISSQNKINNIHKNFTTRFYWVGEKKGAVTFDMTVAIPRIY
jgi:hypothetical protein